MCVAKALSFGYGQYCLQNCPVDLIVLVLLKLPFMMSVPGKYTCSLSLKQRDILSVPVPVTESDHIRQSFWCCLDNGCYNKPMKGEHLRTVVLERAGVKCPSIPNLPNSSADKSLRIVLCCSS